MIFPNFTSRLVLESGADFMVHGIYKYNFFGKELWITTTTISTWTVSIILIIFALFARRTMLKASDVPGTFQNIIEMMVEAFEGMTSGILGNNACRFINYIGTIFLFILLSNLSGLLGMRNPTEIGRAHV